MKITIEIKDEDIKKLLGLLSQAEFDILGIGGDLKGNNNNVLIKTTEVPVESPYEKAPWWMNPDTPTWVPSWGTYVTTSNSPSIFDEPDPSISDFNVNLKMVKNN